MAKLTRRKRAKIEALLVASGILQATDGTAFSDYGDDKDGQLALEELDKIAASLQRRAEKLAKAEDQHGHEMG